MFPWRKMNERHPCSSCSFTYCTNVALWSSRTFLCTESRLPETYYCFFFPLFFQTDILFKIILPCNTCLQILSLHHLNKPWFLRWLSISTGVSYQFHIFFWQHKKKIIICPCLVAVAWPNIKAFLNAEMCCVAAVISLYPKGLLLLSFLQLQRVTCLALEHRGKFDSETERKDVTYLKQWKKMQLSGILPHYIANQIIYL